MKKILIFMIIFIFWNIFFWNLNILNASNACPTWQICWATSWVDNKTLKPCDSEKCLNSPSFMFPTSKLVPGGTYKETETDTEKRINNWLIVTIQKLMIPFWVLATIVMVIWAWYMVLHNWEDEMLNKWKKIFKMWIISISIALSSYIMVEILKNLLYAI